MKHYGAAVFCLGLIAILTVLSIDTSVSSGAAGRVHNIGLLYEKQNLFIASALLTLIGAVMVIVGVAVRPNPQPYGLGQKIGIGVAWAAAGLAAGWLAYGLIQQNPILSDQQRGRFLSVSPFLATDITGAAFARDFKLTDHNGQVRTLADFRGKVVAVFFGYTHCPDVCPTTLSDFAMALQQLGPSAEQVQVVFVTVDPQRDTPELLKLFVPAFNPSFLGMYTDEASLRQLANEYKVVYQKNSVKAADDYLIDHSAGTYVYDKQGNIRLLVPYGSSHDAIAQDLKALLASS